MKQQTDMHKERERDGERVHSLLCFQKVTKQPVPIQDLWLLAYQVTELGSCSQFHLRFLFILQWWIHF